MLFATSSRSFLRSNWKWFWIRWCFLVSYKWFEFASSSPGYRCSLEKDLWKGKTVSKFLNRTFFLCQGGFSGSECGEYSVSPSPSMLFPRFWVGVRFFRLLLIFFRKLPQPSRKTEELLFHQDSNRLEEGNSSVFRLLLMCCCGETAFASKPSVSPSTERLRLMQSLSFICSKPFSSCISCSMSSKSMDISFDDMASSFVVLDSSCFSSSSLSKSSVRREVSIPSRVMVWELNRSQWLNRNQSNSSNALLVVAFFFAS